MSDSVVKLAEADLPIQHTHFTMQVYRAEQLAGEHLALVKGTINADSVVKVRIHSECITGDVFGSARCDCGPQLQQTLKEIAKSPVGMVIYLRQEGRGIGLVNKLKAYQLQDKGLNTVQANQALGFAADLRRFDVAIAILNQLGVKKVELMTNNPEKLKAFADSGIDVVKQTPVLSSVCRHNVAYLQTKKEVLGHWLNNLDLAHD